MVSTLATNLRRPEEVDMNERQRDILQEVADGKISPEDAVQLLDEAEEDADGDPEGAEQRRPSVDTAGIQRVRLVQAFRQARVIGDADVAEAVVEGPHLVEREGDVLVVHGDGAPGAHGFAFSRGDRPWYPSRPGRPRRPGRREPSGHWHHGQWEANWAPGPPGGPQPGPWGGPGWGGPGWGGRWGLMDAFRRFGEEVTVRMRPDLPLDASVTAGSLKIAGITGPLRVAVSGGTAKLDEFRGPLDLSVEAGSAKGSGVLASGSSRIRCQAGSVRIHLERGSSVKVRARAELGNVVLPGDAEGEHWLAGGGAAREVTVGDGAALLEVESNMGNVVVSADR
jgi:hypothetical protein